MRLNVGLVPWLRYRVAVLWYSDNWLARESLAWVACRDSGDPAVPLGRRGACEIVPVMTAWMLSEPD